MNSAQTRADARFSSKANGNGNGNGHSNGNGHKANMLDLNTPITMPTTIVKRDGRVMSFEIERIENALARCFASFGRTPTIPISDLAKQVGNIVAAKYEQPSVENVQDIVEMVLQSAGEFEAAKRYILYRAEHEKLRAERPIPEEVRAAFDESDKYFPSDLQKFQFYDKYSRFNYDLGRRETWIETVDRSVDFLHELAGERLPRETYERLRKGILEMRAMPSMRLLAMAGTAARRSNIAIYNCSYMPVESIDAFVEALIISMSGCGVGYSVERKYVENFPRVKRQTGNAPTTYFVEDSAEGWADALRFGLETWFDGGDVKFDLGLLRVAGAPLKTKGGRASGPEPLRKMFEFIRTRVLARQGSFLRSLDAHDIMCAVGNAAVSGGVRRTAMISLFDYDDGDMLHAKDGDFERDNSQRWNANNSAVLPRGGLTQLEFAKFFLDMVQGGRGEPGIFNRESALAMRPTRRQEAEFGTNPSLRKGTLIYTSNGIIPIELLEGKQFLVRNLRGELSPAECFLSGHDKPLYKITLKGGHSYYATAEHKWPILQSDGSVKKVETTVLKSGDYLPVLRPGSLDYGTLGTYDDGFLAGWMLGDGWVTQRGDTGATQFGLIVGEQDYQESIGQRLENIVHDIGSSAVFAKRTRSGATWYEMNTQSFALETWVDGLGVRSKSNGLPSYLWTEASEEFRRGLIDGLFSADGSVDLTRQPGYPTITLVSAHRKLVEDVSILLGFYGIKTIISESRGPSRFPNNKDYQRIYQRFDLRIAGLDDIAQFRTVFHLSHRGKQARLEAAKVRQKPDIRAVGCQVVSVEATNLREDVWDISVFDETHCFQLAHCITGNCGEIVLRPFEFCNLSVAVARQNDTYESLKDKVELAAIIGTIQSLATHFPGLRKQWQDNCEEERLLGVDINGQLDSPTAQDVNVQRALRDVAIETNRSVAAQLGINQSASVTCVKPSGNSSQLLNCSSGIHARWSPYYIRNVRVATHSPIYKVMRDAGAPMDPENGQTPEDANTYVIHFPVKSPDGAITRKDRTAIQQCEYWLQNKLNWTEHNPSVTITYQPHEILDLMKWVWEHVDYLGGITFLPAFDAMYDQMPYHEIDAPGYEKLAAQFPAIDFSKLYRYEEEDLTTAAQELACLAGVCDVDFAGKPQT